MHRVLAALRGGNVASRSFPQQTRINWGLVSLSLQPQHVSVQRHQPSPSRPICSLARGSSEHHSLQHRDNRYLHQDQQRRWVTSKKRQRQKMRDKGQDPFLVLGVARSETYVHVKKSFLKIAMRHHPDTSSSGTDTEKDANKEAFLAARKAFEAIVEGPGGIAILKSESDDYEEEEDLDAWFKMETGHDMPFMDAQTMKEVAEMTESSDIGLDRDGGMWTLAKMVTQSVRSGGDGRDMLRLEAGTVRDREIDGVLRRRRRR